MERKVSLVLEGKSEGIAQTQAEAQKFGKAVTQAITDQNKGFDLMLRKGQQYGTFWQKFRVAAGFPKLTVEGALFQKTVLGLKQKLADLAKQQIATMHEMEGIDKASDKYKESKDNLDKVVQGIRVYRQELRLLSDAHRKEANEVASYQQAVVMSRGAFTQGLLQGAIPGGNLIQRGPGALQQAAGAAIGGAAQGLLYQRPKTVLGGLAQTPFQGMQGLATAAQGIPVVGGVMAGQIQTTAGFAGMALQRQEALKGLIPQLGAGFQAPQLSAERIAGARAAAAGGVTQAPSAMGVTARKARVAELMKPSWERSADYGPHGGSRRVAALGLAAAEKKASEEDIAAGKTAIGKARREAADKAELDLRQKNAALGIEGMIRGAGKRYAGLNAIEALQAAGAVVQTGGGTFGEMKSQGMIGTSFAAQTRYGVGPETSGAFLRGARRGGLVGAGEGGMNAGEALTKALAEGVELGLRGSEMQEYMQIMANGIQQFQQTGIPVNPTSIADLSRSVSGMGLGPTRGFAVGAGVAAAGQQLAGRGSVQSPIDILMMQKLGGFKGGGLGGYVEAMKQLEGTKFGGKEMQGLFKTFMGSGGGGAAGQIVFHQAMQKMGVKVGWEETGLLQRQMTGKLSPSEQKRLGELQKERGEGAKTPEKLMAEAATVLKGAAPALEKQANIQNKQLLAGQGMLDAAQKMESATANVNTTFTKNIGPAITKISEKVEDLTNQLPALIDALKEWVRRMSPGYDAAP